GLRRLADEHGALLVFDEVMTGFRVGWQGAQGRYGVTPDLTTLGKVIGGGMPIGAYGGKREIMEKVSPLGPVYQAGTLSGNPVAVAAGLATLNALDRPGTYERLETLGQRLENGMEAASRSTGVPLSVQRVGSMLTAFFLDHPVTDYESAMKADTVRFSRVFHALLQQGVYPAPSQFEALFVSLAHTETEIDETVQAFRQALATLEETA
ncbi:MAG: aminotransferase class III-fold pyridoxal phosphate-dependent enzyme, partial [Deltaproteobacteria bacterium]